jgi:hypothetical protein
MTREITHMNAFTAALESMGKGPFLHRRDSSPPVLVINTSTIRLESETKAKLMLAAPGTKAVTGKSSSPAPGWGVKNPEPSGADVKSSKKQPSQKGIRARKTA